MTIGWAMIGTGRVHQWMTSAIKEAGNSRLVAVLSRDKARGAAFAKQHGIDRVYDSLAELLADREVDVVYVASPNGLHSSQTIKAAEAGKHVFCEKPMAPTLAECRSMLETCNKFGVKLGLGFEYRQHPAHLKAREIVHSGELGQLVFANAQVEVPAMEIPGWYYESKMAGGGIIYMLGVHRIDLLRFMLRCEVEEVSAFLDRHPAERSFEEMVVGLLKFDNGVYGTLHFSLNVPHGANSLELHGSKASLFCIDTTSLWWGGSGGELLLKSDAVTVRYQFQKSDVYKDEVRDFNRCVKEGGEPLATGTDGLRAAEISIAMFESSRQGRTIRIGDLTKSGQ